VFKAFAGRPRDWLDIEGIVTRHEFVPRLELKEDAETEKRLRSLFSSLSRPSNT
jgi:hypothetical protein